MAPVSVIPSGLARLATSPFVSLTVFTESAKREYVNAWTDGMEILVKSLRCAQIAVDTEPAFPMASVSATPDGPGVIVRKTRVQITARAMATATSANVIVTRDGPGWRVRKISVHTIAPVVAHAPVTFARATMATKGSIVRCLHVLARAPVMGNALTSAVSAIAITRDGVASTSCARITALATATVTRARAPATKGTWVWTADIPFAQIIATIMENACKAVASATVDGMAINVVKIGDGF